jgi:DNA polymerase III delta prime subunit
MLLSDKYKPTSQKSLFHKDIINHVRKWLKHIETQNTTNHILFVYGPIGSAKSVTINVLLKGFNIHNVDPLELRSHEKACEIASTLPSFRDITLTNLDKSNRGPDKLNVVLVDNIELCDKTISYFVDCVKKNNIPIILICNTPKMQELFTQSNNYNCSFIEFKKPSLLELTKLVTDINTSEKLKLTKENIKALIEKSQYDVRQLFFILQQWTISSSPFKEFLDELQEKHTDIDLVNKVMYFFDHKTPFHLNNSCNLAMSEPLAISCSIFQNYLDLSTNTIDPNVPDSISRSNLIYNKIFDEQYWELYETYAFESCVVPSFYLKQQQLNTQPFSTFKDFSYNYINSYKDIRLHILSTNDLSQTYSTFNNHDTCYFTANILVQEIGTLNIYFESQKKGKNTSKQEKLDMCNNITDPNIQSTLSQLTSYVYNYNLYEIDKDDLLVNKKLYLAEDQLHTRLPKIDIRMLKRFINIFTFHDTSKLIKSHLELVIKYSLLKEFVKTIPNITVSQNLEELTQELSDIWNF